MAMALCGGAATGNMSRILEMSERGAENDRGKAMMTGQLGRILPSFQNLSRILERSLRARGDDWEPRKHAYEVRAG
jgi:hypothetical protein